MCVCLDAGSFQVCPNLETGFESETSYDAALRPETAEDPNEVPGTPVEEE